jgi:predicted TIM-barrel fold metal-dependent hydrolase
MGAALRIDVHAHYFSEKYLDRLDGYGGTQSTLLIRKNKLVAEGSLDVGDLLRNMDMGRVDMQILSVSNQLPYFERESDAVDAAKLSNDIYAEVVTKYPRRFAAFACTPLPHMAASIEEIGRALDDLGMVGIAAGTTVCGRSIADSAFREFFAELNRRKAVLFLHPMGGNAGSPLIESAELTWPIGAPLEDTICMLQLMQAEIPARFPDVKIILPHLGGFAPFLAVRLDQLRARFLPDSAVPPSVQARSFWYDSVNSNPWALRCAWEAVGVDHILFGSDYPFWHDDAYVRSVDYVQEAGLTAKEVDGVLGVNAESLLGI